MGSPPPSAHTYLGSNTKPCPPSPSCPPNTCWPCELCLQGPRGHAMIIEVHHIYIFKNVACIYNFACIRMLFLRMLLPEKKGASYSVIILKYLPRFFCFLWDSWMRTCWFHSPPHSFRTFKSACWYHAKASVDRQEVNDMHVISHHYSLYHAWGGTHRKM